MIKQKVLRNGVVVANFTSPKHLIIHFFIIIICFRFITSILYNKVTLKVFKVQNHDMCND